MSTARDNRGEPAGPGYHRAIARPWLDRAYASALGASPDLDELLRRDKQRAERDGFPQKIRWAKYLYPTRDGKRVIVLPHTAPDRLQHGQNKRDGSGNGPNDESGGAGEGDVGKVLGRQRTSGDGDGDRAGDEAAEHAIVEDAQRMGKLLTEHLKLPNLQNKGGKRSTTRFIYDLTDANRGVGQRLDVQRSIEEIVRTNIAIGRIEDVGEIEPSDLLIGPDDLWYRTLSREPDIEPRALVFFLRDYSGSMYGQRTDLVVGQQLMLYCWLMHQYRGNVTARFILHDTEAKEVPDFGTYHRMSAIGGTRVHSGYSFIERIIEQERLGKDQNLFLFHGTDGEDMADSAMSTMTLLERLLPMMSRVGVTITHPGVTSRSTIETALEISKLLTTYKGRIAMSILGDDAEESIIKSLKEVLA